MRVEWDCFPIFVFLLKTKTMEHRAISIRPFVGAKDFDLSRSFYRDLGFEETVIGPDMSVFKFNALAFYLQKYYVREWIDNTMIFVEVEDVDRYWNELLALNLPEKYAGVKLTPIRVDYWGKECFLHDPSGVLWHFGQFFKVPDYEQPLH
jgi:catechol 2,3-dioxygenase-like lactoylglutathione lyase family enzyme